MPDHGPLRLDRRTLQRGDFVRLDEIRWRDSDGAERRWEAAERTGGQEAVLMIPRLAPSGRLVLIRQYRPPLDAEVVEFPAGLIDEGEDAATTARRELREETGFRGTITHLLPPAYNSPGLTSESVWIARMEIDETREENRLAAPAPDAGEEIEVLLLAPGEAASLLRRHRERELLLDSKVAAFLLGRGDARA
jgi:8-oxo-dGTP pyrophosphatase MutT (NUDIX family)